MSSNPYENEPGYETTDSDQDKKHMKAYAAKVDKTVSYYTLGLC